MVFARQPNLLPTARILRHPRKHSGHVELELCTSEGLKEKRFPANMVNAIAMPEERNGETLFHKFHLPLSSAEGP